MDIIDLIVIIARNYKESVGIAPAKTKLLKLAYLAEIYYKRLTGKRLTDQQWVLWKYGPYLWEYEAMISNEAIFLKPDEADEFYAIEVRDDYQEKEMSIEWNEWGQPLTFDKIFPISSICFLKSLCSNIFSLRAGSKPRPF